MTARNLNYLYINFFRFIPKTNGVNLLGSSSIKSLKIVTNKVKL